ncbi:toll/interleukin-1 receptor domain-containing protein [Arthrobacter cryoconiti]|uniref:Toll/interleukin-1 receptor domain-containing protein n=1 Tax=Arthrobacter cryoconiti TaxID=748907 RepID=A0ABV8R1H7_9MICC|nr:toll/interleukin-1 receptor domain-containing protein [Arthrobacter cryoconiti]MCC9068265.1 toll/interleukin-1 receptor domain-containing protein [Arthrobacter cryoconiti]
MKIFISWSGVTSRAVAEALSGWLPKVIQGVEPFVSAKDIDKGANWTVELSRELESAQYGIICLAPDNLLSPWLNYETGAITKSVDSRVAPVLFNVSKDEVRPPMAQLQLTSIDVEEFELLMMSVNKAAGSRLRDDQVKEAVAVWWPSLETAIRGIKVPDKPSGAMTETSSEPAKPEADVAEMMGEILRSVRRLDSRMKHLEGVPELIAGRDPRLGSYQSAIRFLERALRPNDIILDSIRVKDGRVEVKLTDSLGDEDLLPLIQAAETVAKREQSDVWLLMPDRTITLSATGSRADVPF